MKKVLFIPSWYPYPQLPHAGSFIINQAKALAEYHTAAISILDWGQLEYQLAIRTPWKSMGKFCAYLRSKPHIEKWENGITIYHIPQLSWTHLLWGGNIEGLIPKLRALPHFDLIHAHVSYPAGYVAMKLAQATGIPYLITEHSGPFPLKGLSKGGKVLPIVQQPLSEADAVISVSSALAASIKAKTGISSIVIPNLVDTNFFRPAPQAAINEPFCLFALSALSTAKGILNLLEAVKMLKAQRVDFIIYLGGAGPLSSRLTKEIARWNLQKQLVLLGELNPEQALSYYQKCDCFIMPSHHESFSVVLLEALACGKPIIATACGGPADIVNADCGVLVPPQDSQALAEAIKTMQSSYLQYDPLKIREYCLARYSPRVVASELGKIYSRLVPN